MTLSFNPIDEEDFYNRLRNWESRVRQKYLEYQDTGLFRDENFDNATVKNINLRGMLERIPLEERRRLLLTDTTKESESYAHIIGFHQVTKDFSTQAPLPDFMSPLTETNVSKAYRFMVDPSQLSGEHTNPLAIIFHSLYPNLSTSNPEAGLKLSMNIPTADYLEQMVKNSKEGANIGIGKNILVFDTETAGIIGGSGVRQVSAKMVRTRANEEGKTIYDVLGKNEFDFDEYFDTARMHLGYMADPVTGEAIPMTKVLEESGAATGGKRMGYGEDFVEAMRPFLQKVKEADYLVAHNASFDIDQVFGGLRATAAYKENQNGFRELLDGAAGILDRKGAVLDTLHMAKTHLPELGVNPILEAVHGTTPWSLSNLMLETNLTKLLQDDFGDSLEQMLAKGQHTADVDTAIEAHLFKYMQEGRLAARGAYQVPEAIQRMVFKSYAPTPISKIKDFKDIDKGLLPDLIRERGVHLWDHEAGKLVPFTGTPEELTQTLEGPSAPLAAKFDITPLEQEIWKTRKFGTTAEDVTKEQLLQGIGDWQRYTHQNVPYRGWLNRDSSLFLRGEVPTREAFESLQSHMAEKGIPFAGLSRPERWFTVSMAQASQHRSSVQNILKFMPEEQMLTQHADNLGITRMAAQRDIYLSGGEGKNISLPIGILQKAEEEGILSSNLAMKPEKDVEMLGLSAFKSAETGKPRINLVYKFKGEEEASKFKEWFSKLSVDDKLFEDGTKSLTSYGGMYHMNELIDQITESGVRHGISVGSLNDKAAEHAYRMIRSFTGDIMRDEDAIPMRAGLMDVSGGIVKLGAFVMDRLTPHKQMNYAAEIGLARKGEDIIREIGASTGGAARIATMKNVPEKALPIVEKSWEIYDRLRSNKWAVAGSLAAVVGLHAWNSHKKKTEAGLETVDRMPIESNRDYYNYRKELNLAPAPARRRPDPLLTAGVVGNLDSNKIGHTMMGASNRYGNLYGGAI